MDSLFFAVSNYVSNVSFAVWQSLLSSSDTASHYEALQLLTSSTHRSLKSGEVDLAVKTSFKGTCLLLTSNQLEIGSQMSNTFIEVRRLV